jgi:hypothetical protein
MHTEQATAKGFKLLMPHCLSTIEGQKPEAKRQLTEKRPFYAGTAENIGKLVNKPFVNVKAEKQFPEQTGYLI